MVTLMHFITLCLTLRLVSSSRNSLKMSVYYFLASLAFGALGEALGAATRHRLDGRIVGGSATTIDQYPYQVSIQYSGSHICGGSIISNNRVLTAAHCMVYNSAFYEVRAGSSDRETGGTVYGVHSVARHAKYDSMTFENDVAVIRINGTFQLSDTTKIVELVSLDYVAEDGTNSEVTGWGAVSEGGALASRLQVVKVPIVSNQQCNTLYYGAVSETMVCAGFTDGGKDACQGDSGGPLVVDVSGTRRQIGVVSWGNGCARPRFPGVYASVGNLRAWIAANAGV